MDEEGAIHNVNRDNEEKIRQKKKDKRSKKSAKGVEEAHNVETAKATHSARVSENEGISETKIDHERNKEKKKKMKKIKEAEGDMDNVSRKDELTVEFADNGGGQKVDDAERKRKRREKKGSKEESEMQGSEEVKRDISTNLLEGETVFGKESSKEVVEEKKKKRQKEKKSDVKVGEKDGELIQANSIVNALEIKKDKKKRKDDSFVGSKDTYKKIECDKVDSCSNDQENVPQYVEDQAQSTKEDGNTEKKKKKKKHKKNDNCKDDASAEEHNTVAESTNKRKKKKTSSENGSNDGQDAEAKYANKGKKRKSSLVVNGSDTPSPNKSNKKVRFSDQNEVFTLPSSSNTEKGDEQEDYMVRGKRFTLDEDEIVKGAVLKYIETKNLGDEGLDMVLNCASHPKLKGCWKEIASAIPNRPYRAVYSRARVLFMRSETRKWTQEEYDMILEHQEKHGNQWKPLADELGKHTWHVKDAWRRIKLPNMKKGRWSQEEYQRLFDLVNTDLQLKLSEEKKSKHGMLRDNICWTAISDELSTRANASCCVKWYRQLTSAMVSEGIWADSDDYRMLTALYSMDATCMEDVDWDSLIDHRTGDVCRKRWKQMVLHIGHHGTKSFAEQVEVLAKRYCPHLLEARETWDNKPRVP